MVAVDVTHRIDRGESLPPGAPTVVLSNSLGATMAMWDAQVPELSRVARVVRYDTRGHGGSPVPPGPYDIDDLTDDVVALLDILPTLDVWEQMDAWLARRYFHWTFLIQGGGLPERLIGADPQAWLDHALGALGGTDGMTPAALEEYAAAARVPSVVQALVSAAAKNALEIT